MLHSNSDTSETENSFSVNLARVAIELLKSDIDFDMKNYVKNGFISYNITVPPEEILHDCKTSCCFAGFGSLVIPALERETWSEYIERVFGVEDDTAYSEWNFLFDANWPNSKKQAASRALTLLKDEMPESWAWDDCYFEELSKDQLMKELSSFISDKSNR